MAEADNIDGPALHVVVVGFHHKKGCQVEYSYPPLVPGNPVDSHELPEEWRHLPSLALPDGSHNYEKDTIFFHLPSIEDKCKTLYGISCYRQMDARELRNRGADVTRNSVQKSVCVISKLPLYGLITAKLELITHAYFDEKDFSQVSLLQDTYRNLNSSLNQSLLQSSQAFLGISCRDLVQTFKHKVLVLFKLALLERRVLFFGSPVKPICTALLAVLSLFPGMVEYGLQESASLASRKRKVSETLKVTKMSEHPNDEAYLEIQYSDRDSLNEPVDVIDKNNANIPCNNAGDSNISCDRTKNQLLETEVKRPSSPNLKDKKVKDRINRMEQEAILLSQAEGMQSQRSKLESNKLKTRTDSIGASSVASDEGLTQDEQQLLDDVGEQVTFDDDKLLLEIDTVLDNSQAPYVNSVVNGDVSSLAHHSWSVDEDSSNTATIPTEMSSSAPAGLDLAAQGHQAKNRPERTDSQDSAGSSEQSTLGNRATSLKSRLSSVWSSWSEREEVKIELQDMRPLSPTLLPMDAYGFPLAIFTKGMLCHPYLSLQYYDVLQDINVRGFMVAATNVLYKQKRQLLDVIVDVNEGLIEVLDPELRRQLNLTTADLRFADYIVRSVTDESGDLYLDDTSWEGGDEWLRGQFRLYLLYMLSTTEQNDERLVEDFNTSFINAWKFSHNYKHWKSKEHTGMKGVTPGHPFHGNVGVADMKLKLTHSMQNTERGKKINAAMVQTGKVVAQTGKVVGGAITSARSAVSSWFTSLATDWRQPSIEQAPEEASEVKDASESEVKDEDESEVKDMDESEVKDTDESEVKNNEQ